MSSDQSAIDSLRDLLQRTGLRDMFGGEAASQLDLVLTALEARSADTVPPRYVPPSIETLRGWVDDLLKVFDDFEAESESVAEPQLFSLAASWWVTTNRLARAILALHDVGLDSETTPLLRSLIEYSLWLAVLARDDGRIFATKLRAADHEQKSMRKRAAGGLLELPQELLDLVETAPAIEGEGSPVKSFLKVCEYLRVSDTVGVIWQILSSVAHPTTASASLHSQLSPNGVYVRKSPPLFFGPGQFSRELLLFATECLLWAGWAFDRFLESHPLGAQLKPIADQAMITDFESDGVN